MRTQSLRTQTGPDFQTAFSEANWSEHTGALAPMPCPDAPRIAALRASLAQEHRDLDIIIAVLSRVPAHDGSLMSRLKKRKLHIKDEIWRIARQPAS